MPIGEFELIEKYFAPLAATAPGAFGLKDDAAVVAVGEGMEIVATVDALVAAVHFLPDDSADLVARKLLRVNLSDLAAMGAKPRGYLITTSMPRDIDEAWIAAFADGLKADQDEFEIPLLGGDTTSTPGPLALSLTALGELPRGTALMRNAARAGQQIYVSGAIGDAALGLAVLEGRLPDLPAECKDYLIDRYRLPRPRLALGQALREEGLTACAIDISDGLVADLGHVCSASRLAAVIELDRIPLSKSGRTAVADRPDLLRQVLSGGDDYELLFTVDSKLDERLADLSRKLGLPLQRIGAIEPGKGVRILDEQGKSIEIGQGGWSHF